MAKSQYSVKVEPYLELIEGWTRDGLVMSQIAEKLGISKTTLYKYMQEHSELSERLKKGGKFQTHKWRMNCSKKRLVLLGLRKSRLR